jgi:hypothetical protein
VLRGRSGKSDGPGGQSHLPGIVTEPESLKDGGIGLPACSFVPMEMAISQGPWG